jgi:hypothetical protein
MNSVLVPVFYWLMAIAALWLILLWCARVKPGRRTRILAAAIGLATLGLLFIPIGELPLWSRVFSFFANPSLPLVGIVCAALWRRLFEVPVLTRTDWSVLWYFGAIGGTALYLHPMMFGGVDLYYWGWDRNAAVITFASVAVLLLACGQRVGVLVLVALVAYGLNALESQNSWDYIMDPIYWLISIVVVGLRLGGRAIRAKRSGAGWLEAGR